MKFAQELEQLVNKHSLENGSNTPDFILARYLFDCLTAFDNAVFCRSNWYGNKDSQSVAGQGDAQSRADQGDEPGTTGPAASAPSEDKSSSELLGELLDNAGLKLTFDRFRDSTKGCGPHCLAWERHDAGATWCENHRAAMERGEYKPNPGSERTKSCPKCGHLWNTKSKEPWPPCDDVRHAQTESEAIEYKQRRIEELRELYDAELDRNDKLETELVRYREALKFYAKGDHTYSHPENAVSDYRWDSGNRAREALKPKLRG